MLILTIPCGFRVLLAWGSGHWAKSELRPGLGPGVGDPVEISWVFRSGESRLSDVVTL